MGKNIWGAAFIALAILGFAITYYVDGRESLDQAYERGYEDARSVLLDTLYNRWFNDSLGWGLSLNAKRNIRLYSTESERNWHSWKISEADARAWYKGIDSTDTMPAVDSAIKKEVRCD